MIEGGGADGRRRLGAFGRGGARARPSASPTPPDRNGMDMALDSSAVSTIRPPPRGGKPDVDTIEISRPGFFICDINGRLAAT